MISPQFSKNMVNSFYVEGLLLADFTQNSTCSGMLVPCLNEHHEPPNNSPIDAGKGWADTLADSLTQSLTDEVTALIRSERHAQNNNKTADWYKAMLMNPRLTA